jgi:hypothetical protein
MWRCGHTIGTLGGIGKAVGRRCGMRVYVLEIYSRAEGRGRRAERDVGKMESSVSTPLSGQATPPAPALL